MAMAAHDEPESPAEPDEGEQPAEHLAVRGTSSLYAAALKGAGVQAQYAWIGKLIASSTMMRMPVVPRVTVPVVPRVVDFSHLTQISGIGAGLQKQIASMTSLNDMIRQAISPITASITASFLPEWHGLFASLADLSRRLYPENLREAAPGLDDLELLLIDEGIPLMWVPGASTVQALLDAPDAPTRRAIIGRRWKGIATDCEHILSGVTHSALQGARGFGQECVAALRDGHASAAQALASNLLDSVLQRHFDKPIRIKLTKNDFKAKGVKFELDDYKFKAACTFAPVWCAHAKYVPSNGDPIPRTFGRHPSTHGVSRAQYSRVNAVYALMLVTSVIKFFDTELAR